MDKFEYTVKIYSMDNLKDSGVDVEAENNIVYACRPRGECEVHNVGIEQLDNLSGLFNKDGGSRMGACGTLFPPVRCCELLEEAHRGPGNKDRTIT